MGLSLKPTGRASYLERIKETRDYFLIKIQQREQVFKTQSAWGAARVKHFTGACKKVDLILVPKYARQVGLLLKKHTDYLNGMKKSFQKLIDGYLKKLTKGEVLTPKWQKKLIFPLADMIKVAVKEASSHPKVVLKYQKEMAKKYKAHMKRVAAREAVRDAKTKVFKTFEAKKQSANSKMDTITKIHKIKDTKDKTKKK